MDNFKEGMIIIPENSDKIKLMNTSARNILKLPETSATFFEERMLADEFDIELLQSIQLKKVQLNAVLDTSYIGLSEPVQFVGETSHLKEIVEKYPQKEADQSNLLIGNEDAKNIIYKIDIPSFSDPTAANSKSQ